MVLMHNSRISMQNDRTALSIFRIMTACGLVAGLAACNGTSSGSSEDQAAAAGKPETIFDAGLEETPCEVVTAKIVAETFSIPTDKIEDAGGLSDNCNYEGKVDGKILNVKSSVDVFETAADAVDSFRHVTAGMSASQVSRAMAKAKDQARKDGGLDTKSKQKAAGAVVDGVASGGLKFVDVEDLADEARFGLRYGKLYLVRGNMRTI